MAVENAAVLCEMLSGNGSWDSTVPKFVARREPRVRFVEDQSRRMGRVGQIENAALGWIRNWAMWATPSLFTEAGVRRVATAAI